ncbi:adenylyl-sulfate kinase [bacterium]|nr:adenylyl-sulfate kinase [bacterium]
MSTFAHTLPSPHGGNGLVTRILPELERDRILRQYKDAPVYEISSADLSVFYRIADGALSPLEGPMNRDEFSRVLEKETIERNGKEWAWTIPVAFPVAKADTKSLKKGVTALVKDPDGAVIGLITISDVYPFDKDAYNASVYGTGRNDHPGARIFNDDPRDHLLGGTIWAFPQPKDPDFGQYMLTPAETRALFRQQGWERVVAFQTRNALHRAHEYALLYAAEELTRGGAFTGAVLNPLVGATKSDDVPADVRMHTYEALLESGEFGQGDEDPGVWKKAGYGFKDNLLLIGLDMKMFYAGPKEAIMHAIYRQNYGFTDIVIGRKHADAPYDDGSAIWGDFDAHEKFETLGGALEIQPAKVGFAAYFEEIKKVGLIETYQPKGYHTVFISGKEVRRKLEAGEEVDTRIMRKPVADILREFYKEGGGNTVRRKSSNVVWHDTGVTKAERAEKNRNRGVVLWFTGLSGCGKSTVAVSLQGRLFEMGYQTTVLDGDNVRHGLNGDLGFSPEDRTENIRRIGEVAHLFAEAGMIAMTAFISPYAADRDRARGLSEPGAFIEIFCDSPLEVCEQRDVKGLYKKAREGIIKEFTGISAPYEVPKKAEIVLDTAGNSLHENVEIVLEYLRKKNIIW